MEGQDIGRSANERQCPGRIRQKRRVAADVTPVCVTNTCPAHGSVLQPKPRSASSLCLRHVGTCISKRPGKNTAHGEGSTRWQRAKSNSIGINADQEGSEQRSGMDGATRTTNQWECNFDTLFVIFRRKQSNVKGHSWRGKPKREWVPNASKKKQEQSITQEHSQMKHNLTQNGSKVAAKIAPCICANAARCR